MPLTRSWLPLALLSAMNATVAAQARPVPGARDTIAAYYGRQIGRWEIRGEDLQEDGSKLVSTGTLHTYWMHEGLMLQEDLHLKTADGATLYRGTTLRAFVPESGTWRLSYLPVARLGQVLTGTMVRRDGELIESWASPGGGVLELRRDVPAGGTFRQTVDFTSRQGKTTRAVWNIVGVRRLPDEE